MKYFTNKNEFNALIANLVKTHGRPCVKLALDNIVFPRWSEMGAYAYMHKYMPTTAEQPDGYAYPHAKFQSVLRVLGGKVLFEDTRRADGKRTDNYCWEVDKVNNLVAQGKTRPIGTGSTEGLLNLMALAATVTDPEDKLILAETFSFSNKDMLLAHTDAENRVFIRVTQELYDAGLTLSADEWIDADADGMAEASKLTVGDVIIVTTYEDGSVTGYRVEEAIFEQTYSY